MSKSNIIFGTKTAAVAPKIIAPKPEKKTDPKPRKKRSDAKQDIKFKLSQEDKKFIKLHAMDHGLSLTAFASQVVKKELLRDRDYEPFEYDDGGQFVHVMLEQDFFEMVKTLSLDWDLPFRKVVHRIIKDYIWRANGGVKITHYNN